MMYIVIAIIITVILYIILFCLEKYRIYRCQMFTSKGLRNPYDYDGYEDKGIKQFRDECARFSVSTDPYNTPNLCSIIPVLNMKGLHLEFVKDGNEVYCLSRKKNIGSEEWQEKWRKIIFSPTITSVEFCKCVKTIMHAHKFTESDNMHHPYIKGLDGCIKVENSYFIFRALHIMHYNIRLRKNDDSYLEFMISNSKELKKRNDPHFKFSYPDLALHMKTLSSVADFYVGDYINENEITIDSSRRGLIFSSDIDKGYSSLFYNNIYVHDEVNQGYIVINQKKPFNVNRWRKDECILTPNIFALEIIYEDLLADYLVYYLKYLITKLIELDDFENIIPDVFSDLIIPVPPRSVQKSIILQNTLDDISLIDTQIKSIIDSSIENNISIFKNASIGINDDTLIVSPRKWIKGYYKKNGTYVRGYFKN